jgi:Right handed beta helix region
VKSLPILFVAGICAILAVQTSSAEVAVGNCRPHLVSYSTISEAVAAVPPGSTVLVCPGEYPEQVTITQPLTLKGLSDGLTSRAVITVPSGGIVSSFGQTEQISVRGDDAFEFGPVDISNLVVDGTGSGFNCSAGTLVGIGYEFADGTLDNVETRNQSPGGCGFGIVLTGGFFLVNSVSIRNSSVHDFDNAGILATSGGETGFLVNTTFNWVWSLSTSVQAGIDYEFADGLTSHNTITTDGAAGLLLDNFFAGMTAKDNTITGANVGILSGTSLGSTTITGNSLFNNGTGILVSGLAGSPIVNANTIVQSRTAAVDVNCSEETTVEHNIIFGAPVGIANVSSGDTVTPNVFYVVPTKTTACP